MYKESGRGSNPRIYTAILALLPFAIFLINRNWPFQNFGDTDAWFYFGHFLHFPHYQKLQATYAGERLGWILPGLAAVRLLGPIAGTLVLHFVFYEIAVFSLFAMVTRFAGLQAGFLSAIALGIYPYFLAASGIDYVPAPCIAYGLVSFSLLVRAGAERSRGAAFLAGIVWAAAVYTHLLWALFTPACLLVHLAGTRLNPSGRRTFPRDAIAFAAGAAALTGGFLLIYRGVVGPGAGFERHSIETAILFATARQLPWIGTSFSVTFADWLVFPGVAAVLALGLTIPGLRLRLAVRDEAAPLAWAYLYIAAVMMVGTIRAPRYLEFDTITSFLLPGTFLILGIGFFSFAAPRRRALFWLAIAAAVAITLAPLAKPGLYVKAPVRGAVAPGGLLLAALVIRFLRPRSAAGVATAGIAMAAAAFCLAPAVGGIAWRDLRDWMVAEARVAVSVETIASRLPYEKYPAFWYAESDPNHLEFQGIMSAFVSHLKSMTDFPVVDRRFAPGQVVILLTPATDEVDRAADRMARAGMPLSVLWRQSISRGGVSYWITATQVHAP